MGLRSSRSESQRDRAVEQHIRAAAGGSAEDLGRLLDGCRQYLLLVAGEELPRGLKPKLGASDLVQETFLEAQRNFEQFRGRSEAELLAWLRQILLRNLRDSSRFHGAEKRRIDREVRLSERRSGRDGGLPAALVETSSWLAHLRESDEQVGQALDRLSADHRRVIVLRNLELKSFEEIGCLMDRSPDAARKLWRRALAALQQQAGACDAC